jgi:hypothetical protein
VVTYLLTPWSRVLLEKLTGFEANQEIPRVLWNPKVHYRTHKRPPPVVGGYYIIKLYSYTQVHLLAFLKKIMSLFNANKMRHIKLTAENCTVTIIIL